MKRRPWIDALVTALLALGALLWLIPKVTRSLDIDRCLDGGGRWDYSADRCEL